MPGKISFYVAGDEASIRMINHLEELVRKLGDRVKISFSSYVGMTVNRLKVRIPSLLSGEGELEIDVNVVADEYLDYIKARMGLQEIPAAQIGDEVMYGERAEEVAEELTSLLNEENITIEDLARRITQRAPKPVQSQPIQPPQKPVQEPREYRGLYGATLKEILQKLDKLLQEGKITREKYERMKRRYKELFQ